MTHMNLISYLAAAPMRGEMFITDFLQFTLPCVVMSILIHITRLNRHQTQFREQVTLDVCLFGMIRKKLIKREIVIVRHLQAEHTFPKWWYDKLGSDNTVDLL